MRISARDKLALQVGILLIVLATVAYGMSYINATNRKLRQLFDPALTSGQLLDVEMSFDPSDRTAIPTLLHVIEKDNSKRVVRTFDNRHDGPSYVNKWCAIDALSRIDHNNPRLEQLLQQMLVGPDWEFRCMAAVHLGDRSRMLPEISAMLNGAVARERLCAAIALSRIGSEAAACIPKLIALLDHDPDAAVRTWAARVLPIIGPANLSVYAAEIRTLSDPEKNVRVAAQEGLIAMANGTAHSW